MKRKLGSLRVLHEKMRAVSSDRASFGILMFGHPVSCVFLCDSSPYYLHIATLGKTSLSIEFDITSDYEIGNSYIDNIGAWARYFELSYDPENPFTPKSFFEVFDIQARKATLNTKPKYSDILQITYRGHDDSNARYFVGTYNNAYPKSMSNDNYLKTRKAFGRVVADRYRAARISTKWSDDPTKEDLSILLRDVCDIKF